MEWFEEFWQLFVFGAEVFSQRQGCHRPNGYRSMVEDGSLHEGHVRYGGDTGDSLKNIEKHALRRLRVCVRRERCWAFNLVSSTKLEGDAGQWVWPVAGVV